MSVALVSLWIRLASLFLLIALGLGFAMAAHPPLAGLANLFIDFVLWPIDGADTVSTPANRVSVAIGGGITLGWGVMIWQVASRLLPHDPQLAKALLVPTLLSWFVVDSTASLLAGSPVNAALNVALLATFLVPLWLMRK